MKLFIILITIMFVIILYLLNKIEKQKIKILYISKQNHLLLKKIDNTKNIYNNTKNLEFKPTLLNIKNVCIKNTTTIKLAPFDFSPKLLELSENSSVDIISKIYIMNILSYEVSINNQNANKINGWVKDCNTNFVYTK